MDEYLIWLIFLALAIFALSMVQLKDRNCRRLLADNQQLQTGLDEMQARLREREMNIDQMQRSSANLLKWKNRAAELEEELRATKRTEEYASASRLEYLESCLKCSTGENQNIIFLETFQPRGLYTFEERLRQMLESAKFEVIIVSPWIKRQMWERMKGPLKKFARRGGRLRVFIRGCESDFSAGFSDDIIQDVRDLGGDVFTIKQLHAKLYVIDRKEAIIASANLTKGGIEGNYETGVWLNDPSVMSDICRFLEDLYRCR
jgi:sugar-specific transcriptional regulator TrmB